MIGDDLDRLMAVMERAFDPQYGEAWTRRQVEDSLLLGNCYIELIAAHGAPPAPGDAAAGFAFSRAGLEEEELLLFAIDPDYRRKGLGSLLLERFAKAARARGATRLLLEMRSGNPAEILYRQFGFEPIGRRPKYYRTPDGVMLDAITFAKDNG